MKKLAIIGRGTAGCLSVAHFLRYTDWEIDWYFDPDTPPQAVGEGADLILPKLLFHTLEIDYEKVNKLLNGYIKLGIKKINWGKKNTEFIHNFSVGSYSYHFTATKLQDYIIEVAAKNRRVRIIPEKISFMENIDASHIMSCAGKPSDFSDYQVSEYIPVNAVHVTQCYWDNPQFPYTMAIARPYGWVFGIPLTNRCSIGYLYNHKINTLEQVKEDVKNIFYDLQIVPSDKTNSFTFNNYYHKSAIGDRISYNGNASFFLEPLEATSIAFMDYINRLSYSSWIENQDINTSNIMYHKMITCIENIIMLHYYAGSKFDTEFWRMAQQKGENNMDVFAQNNDFATIVSAVPSVTNHTKHDVRLAIHYGTWGLPSFFENLTGLGIASSLHSKVQAADAKMQVKP